MIRGVLLGLALATPLAAECPPEGDTFLSCTVEGGKRLEVCVSGSDVTYAFGRADAAEPELALREPIREIDYRPWPGVGRAIWEEVVFLQSGHFYHVFAGVDRDVSDTSDEIVTTSFGGVEVYRGDTLLVRLACLPDTAQFEWTDAISIGKAAAGLAWDRSSQSWIPAPQN